MGTAESMQSFEHKMPEILDFSDATSRSLELETYFKGVVDRVLSVDLSAKWESRLKRRHTDLVQKRENAFRKEKEEVLFAFIDEVGRRACSAWEGRHGGGPFVYTPPPFNFRKWFHKWFF